MADKIKLRRDTQDNWEAVNPILDEGELGVITDRNTAKIGDGTLEFNNLQGIHGVPEGWTNVKDFGAKGDGITDDTIAIQNAINVSPDFSVIYFPGGTYILSNEIVTGSHNFIGDSDAILHFNGSNGIYITSSGIYIKNLTLEGDNGTDASGTVDTKGLYYTENIANLYVKNLTIKSFGDSGISFKTGLQNYVEQIVFLDNGENTTAIEGGASFKLLRNDLSVTTTSMFKDFYLRRGGQYGFYIDGTVDSTFENIICEYHTYVGYTVNLKRSTFINVYMEANTNNQVDLNESYIVQINTRGTWNYTYSNLGFALRYHTEISPFLVKTKEIVSDNKVVFNNLPTTDPHVVNQIWNDGGTLKVSNG